MKSFTVLSLLFTLLVTAACSDHRDDKQKQEDNSPINRQAPNSDKNNY